jgi:hypothetical protein
MELLWWILIEQVMDISSPERAVPIPWSRYVARNLPTDLARYARFNLIAVPFQGIEKRIAEWSHIPQNNGESMNLLKYELGQEYKPHFDFFNGEEWTRNVGNRLATVLMYLSDVEDGGETIFPNAEGGAIKVKPKAGDAVLFFDLTTENQGDNYSLHGSIPVIKGTKWAMTRWIRERKYH